MGYMHIDNSYKHPDFFVGEDKEVYALEKIHGTSAHVAYELAERKFYLFSGGEKMENFAKLFDPNHLSESMHKLLERHGKAKLVVYGEAYGGRQQGMKDTYGPQLRFVAFDVLVNDTDWLTVPEAQALCNELGIEFVWWTRCANKLSVLDALRDQDSQQAIRNGMGAGKMAEGIVIRPLTERSRSDGKRIILKHKRAQFFETKRPREVSMDKVEALKAANEIAEEWVTEERLNHVLSQIEAVRQNDASPQPCVLVAPFEARDTPVVIRVMLADIKREGEGEIEWSKDAERAVCTRAAQMFKRRILQPTQPN